MALQAGNYAHHLPASHGIEAFHKTPVARIMHATSSFKLQELPF
jgi:hypothetical protein